jgi:hypothetical protein
MRTLQLNIATKITKPEKSSGKAAELKIPFPFLPFAFCLFPSSMRFSGLNF